jgi:hypothetical protein
MAEVILVLTIVSIAEKAHIINQAIVPAPFRFVHVFYLASVFPRS